MKIRVAKIKPLPFLLKTQMKDAIRLITATGCVPKRVVGDALREILVFQVRSLHNTDLFMVTNVVMSSFRMEKGGIRVGVIQKSLWRRHAPLQLQRQHRLQLRRLIPADAMDQRISIYTHPAVPRGLVATGGV